MQQNPMKNPQFNDSTHSSASVSVAKRSALDCLLEKAARELTDGISDLRRIDAIMNELKNALLINILPEDKHSAFKKFIYQYAAEESGISVPKRFNLVTLSDFLRICADMACYDAAFKTYNTANHYDCLSFSLSYLISILQAMEAGGDFPENARIKDFLLIRYSALNKYMEKYHGYRPLVLMTQSDVEKACAKYDLQEYELFETITMGQLFQHILTSNILIRWTPCMPENKYINDVRRGYLQLTRGFFAPLYCAFYGHPPAFMATKNNSTLNYKNNYSTKKGEFKYE